MADEHLHNAARELERILARKYPDHVFTVGVGPRRAKVGSVSQHPNAIGDRGGAPSGANRENHDRGKQAA